MREMVPTLPSAQIDVSMPLLWQRRFMHSVSFTMRRAPQQSSGSPLAQNRKLKASDTRLLKHTPCSVFADGLGLFSCPFSKN